MFANRFIIAYRQLAVQASKECMACLYCNYIPYSTLAYTLFKKNFCRASNALVRFAAFGFNVEPTSLVESYSIIHHGYHYITANKVTVPI